MCGTMVNGLHQRMSPGSPQKPTALNLNGLHVGHQIQIELNPPRGMSRGGFNSNQATYGIFFLVPFISRDKENMMRITFKTISNAIVAYSPKNYP